jgi:hypothetical protein
MYMQIYMLRCDYMAPQGRLIRQDTGDHTMDEMAQLEEIWVTVAHASWLQGL